MSQQPTLENDSKEFERAIKKGKISLNHRHACFRRCVSIRARKEPLAMNEANILPFELCSSRSLCGAAVVV